MSSCEISSRCSIPVLSLRFFVFVSTFLSLVFIEKEDQIRIKLVRLNENLLLSLAFAFLVAKNSLRNLVDPRSKNNENEIMGEGNEIRCALDFSPVFDCKIFIFSVTIAFK